MSAEQDFMRMILDFMNDDPMTATYYQYAIVYNPATSENEELLVSQTLVHAILLDFDRTSNGFSTKFGTLIEAGDKELYMLPTQKEDPLATPIIPNPAADRITVAGITYKVVIVKSADPTGSNPLLYNIMLRR